MDYQYYLNHYHKKSKDHYVIDLPLILPPEMKEKDQPGLKNKQQVRSTTFMSRSLHFQNLEKKQTGTAATFNLYYV